MNNVKWVGTPARYTRSRTQKKCVSRWMGSVPVQQVKPETDAAYWLCVISFFLLCIAVMAWAALASV